MTTTSVATLILAAGPSQRFGSCKALAAVGEKTLIRHMISLAQTATPGHVYVVTGAYHDLVTDNIGDRAQTIYNAQWEQGMGVSLARGIAVVGKKYDAVMILLSDQVALNAGHLEALLKRWKQAPERPACAYYEGEMGVPAVFPKSYFPRLMDLSGAYGAKSILRDKKAAVDSVPMPEAAVDIDTQADLSRWAKA